MYCCLCLRLADFVFRFPFSTLILSSFSSCSVDLYESAFELNIGLLYQPIVGLLDDCHVVDLLFGTVSITMVRLYWTDV